MRTAGTLSELPYRPVGKYLTVGSAGVKPPVLRDRP